MQTLDSLQLQRSTILFTFHTPRGTLSQERTPRLRKSFSLLGIGSSGPELHQNTSHPRDGLRATLARQGLQSTTADSSSGNHFTRGNNELPGTACWIRSLPRRRCTFVVYGIFTSSTLLSNHSKPTVSFFYVLLATLSALLGWDNDTANQDNASTTTAMLPSAKPDQVG